MHSMPLKSVLLMLLALLLAEVGLFMVVAHQIGLWTTIGLGLVTSLAGALLLRQVGRAAFGRLRAPAFAAQSRSLAGTGTAIVFRGIAAILLLAPGFITDAVGVALIVPAVQRRVRAAFQRLIRATPRTKPESTVVDLDPSEWERRAGSSS